MTTGALTGCSALGRGGIERWVLTGGADTAATCSTAVGQARRLIWAAVHYSAAPTQAGVTVTLNCGSGAAYDTVLHTGSANAADTVYIPTQDLLIMGDDAIDVAAPAGGATITARIVIYTEPL